MLHTKTALVAFGANLPFGGNMPQATVAQAVLALAERGLAVMACSPLYRTPCFPAGAGPDYVNAAAVLAVPDDMGAAEVLAQLHSVEAAFGRARDTRWGRRTLDIDLLAIGDAVLPDATTHAQWRMLAPEAQVIAAPDRLILPHPRLQDRAFVLVPLADVAPDWVHPVLGLSVAQMLAALPEGDRADVHHLVDAVPDCGVVKPL